VPVLIDTSGLYALADRGDPAHRSMHAFLAATRDVYVVPLTVVPEVDYLVAERLGVRVELSLLRALAAGEFQLEGLLPGDFDRSIELIEQYSDSDIGFVDASIVALAERLRIERILTLDQRHFRMFRPRHCAAFELVP
jgi:predicted nucleic acid-binding protein